MSHKAVTWAYEQTTGDPLAKSLLVKLADYANEEQGFRAWPKRATLVRELEMSLKSIDRKADLLVALGLVEKQPRYVDGKQRSNVYVLRVPLVEVLPDDVGSGNGSYSGSASPSQTPLGRTDSRPSRVPEAPPNPQERPTVAPDEACLAEADYAALDSLNLTRAQYDEVVQLYPPHVRACLLAVSPPPAGVKSPAGLFLSYARRKTPLPARPHGSEPLALAMRWAVNTGCLLEDTHFEDLLADHSLTDAEKDEVRAARREQLEHSMGVAA
jgi:hypothetical protein